MGLPVVSTTASARTVRRADVTEREWFDWRWQLRNMLVDADDLGQVISLSEQEKVGFTAAETLFRVGITPYYADIMDPSHSGCPIRMPLIETTLSDYQESS